MYFVYVTNMRNLLALGFVLICTIGFSFSAIAKDNQRQISKARLVLMPMRVDESDRNLLGAMETSLVEGLQQKYEVYSGEIVSKKAHEIYLKESREEGKTECDEIKCLQKIAESFQSELLGIANVTKRDGGYFIAFSIQNIFDNKVVFSNSIPCDGCTSFQVVEKIKELSDVVDDQSNLKLIDNIDGIKIGDKFSDVQFKNEIFKLNPTKKTHSDEYDYGLEPSIVIVFDKKSNLVTNIMEMCLKLDASPFDYGSFAKSFNGIGCGFSSGDILEKYHHENVIALCSDDPKRREYLIPDFGIRYGLEKNKVDVIIVSSPNGILSSVKRRGYVPCDTSNK